jgi:RNA polymerase sigma-70 factor (ECF subfamily)
MNEAARAHHHREIAGDLPDVATETRGPLEELERSELSKAIEAALAQLPPKQRAAVILARFEDLPYREIGEVLDVSEGAVDSLFYDHDVNQ